MADQNPAQRERPFCPACDLNVNACTCDLDGELILAKRGWTTAEDGNWVPPRIEYRDEDFG